MTWRFVSASLEFWPAHALFQNVHGVYPAWRIVPSVYMFSARCVYHTRLVTENENIYDFMIKVASKCQVTSVVDRYFSRTVKCRQMRLMEGCHTDCELVVKLSRAG